MAVLSQEPVKSRWPLASTASELIVSPCPIYSRTLPPAAMFHSDATPSVWASRTFSPSGAKATAVTASGGAAFWSGRCASAVAWPNKTTASARMEKVVGTVVGRPVLMVARCVQIENKQ
jgi:hypothetical protein